MAKRIARAGGNEKFADMMDRFFGFGQESVEQIRSLDAYDEIASKEYHRFQGFNNECDMESPYAYIYAGKHHRTCSIVHECVTRAFTTGRGAIPGNNDSGGLSSCFVWNVLGLFPVAGKGDMLFGSPHVKEAVIHLNNGRDLRIVADNLTCDNYWVDSVNFNGKKIYDFAISVREIMHGGQLTFNMKKGGDTD